MPRKSVLYLSAIAVLVVPVFAVTAQMHQHWSGSQTQGNASCPHFDLANKVTLEGVVDTVNMERGQGAPSFTLVQSGDKKVTVIASPYWALVNANYKIGQGDRMLVVAYQSLQYENIYVASQLTNQGNGMTLTLRDATGTLVGGRGGRCGACPFGHPGGF